VQEADADADTASSVGTTNVTEIHLQSGVHYQLTINGTDQTAAAGDLDITHNTVVDGQGATIDDVLSGDRTFHVGPSSSTPTVTIQGVTINGGDAQHDGTTGGAVLFDSGTLALSHVTIENAVADTSGGAIAQSAGAGALTIDHSSILGDVGTGDGGALVTSGPATVRTTELSGNEAHTGNGGAIHQLAGSLTLTDDTFDFNLATFTSPQRGGAIATEPGSTLAISRSTFNSDGARKGNGIWSNGTTTIRSSTFVEVFNGGAFVIGAPAGTLSIGGSLVAEQAGNDVGMCSGPLTSLGSNEVQDSTCGLTATGDRVVADPTIGDLGDHGGGLPTQLPGGELLDAIPLGTAGLCPAATDPPTTDERGQPVPSGAACDIGAVERQPTDP
jgi:hypothetical protein